jgi:6-methylsalicylate decarboxylase
VPFLTFRFQHMAGGDEAPMKDNPGAIALIQKLYFDTAQNWSR